MMRPFEVLKTALPYLAKSKEAKVAFDKLLRQVNRDLEDAGYVTSTATDRTVAEFENILNELDEQKSDIRELQRKVEAEMEDDDE
jgi:hypothetical protein